MRNFVRQTRLLLARGLQEYRQTVTDASTPSRPQFAQLEERILMSATPAATVTIDAASEAAVATMAETAPEVEVTEQPTTDQQQQQAVLSDAELSELVATASESETAEAPIDERAADNLPSVDAGIELVVICLLYTSDAADE